MKRYIARRLLQIIPVIIGVSIIVFVLLRLTGDPVILMLPEDATPQEIESLTTALGLDKPLHVQYWVFFKNALKGDFGRSFRFKAPALEIVLERMPYTLQLAGAAMLVALVIAIPLGIISAIRQNSIIDLTASTVSVLGRAMPNFWLGLMLIIVFAVVLRWLPVSGKGTLAHLILPAATLGTGMAATITRLIRSSMLEVIRQDFITTARSKGLSESVVIYKHALRNALIPVVTIIGIQTASLMGGAVVTEQVFAWGGIGQLAVLALNMRDMALVQAIVMVMALIIISANLFVDIIYCVIDPRISFE